MSNAMTASAEKPANGEPQVTRKHFSALQEYGHDLGLVVLGAGEPQQEWVNGIADLLVKSGIAQAPVFSDAFIIDGNVRGSEGRIDLALIFSKESKPNVGKLAMWRIQFGDASWIYDFVVNHENDYCQQIDWPEEQRDKFEDDSSRGSRIRLCAAQLKTNNQSTFSNPLNLTWRSGPVCLNQPKPFSTSHRLLRLTL